jgi:hypothetical protein
VSGIFSIVTIRRKYPLPCIENNREKLVVLTAFLFATVTANQAVACDMGAIETWVAAAWQRNGCETKSTTKNSAEGCDGRLELDHHSCGGIAWSSEPCWLLGGINRCFMLGRQLCQRLAPRGHIGVTCGVSRTLMVGRCSHERRLIRSMGR